MSRPRGFIESWSPMAHTETLISQVEEVLDDLVPQVGAVTLRQLFYRLVVTFDYEKTEKAYKRLCETMNKARRARRIPMYHIRDDGMVRKVPREFSSRDSFVDSLVPWARQFKLRRQDGQPHFLIVWCEAQGMVPQLERAVSRYGVPVFSSGGFDSLTSKHEIASQIAGREVPTVILHVGDRDPSVEHIHMSLFEDLGAFVDEMTDGLDRWGEVQLKRVAVTVEQIEELDLPTAPPKASDRRSFHGPATQAEAIDPTELRDIVRREVELHMDAETYDSVRREETEIRRELIEKLERIR